MGDYYFVGGLILAIVAAGAVVWWYAGIAEKRARAKERAAQGR